MQGARIISVGSAVPDLCINNKDISEIVETSDEWIVTRTGIKERRVLTGANKSVVDLAYNAAMKALNNIQMDPLEIDLIILATSSPNDLFGSASKVQAKIGAKKAVAFDLTAACSGFVLAIVTAAQFIQNGSYKNILIIGADVLSKWIDWSDRKTCILFGDGAGAAIIQACSEEDNAILGFQLNTDGKQSDELSITYKENPYSLNTFQLFQGQFQYISMNGKEVYKFAVSKVPASITKCLNALHLSTKDVTWLLLHQANKRILNAVANRLSIDTCKIISNLSKYGNTSAASIPLALDEALQNNRITKEDIIVISGFGAGLTWGTVVIKWKC
uniref:beta-ketoacyl-acyl carrier protein synthase III n=1 Tax=Gracilaria isabellana TaxID=1183060 RepID=UPI001D124FF7|nr:beta-ketoacyl-acyl carrier protein synthase III [Gracilaria isabellana]YP_010198711.1 beta-ketoacyl-acyl carrier protein synthase III [Gracilaria tikvahiae]UAD86132.1 beta-ketoacyl-acyl carrier protein synthase III [Gracilaria isabellana]UAD87944.1 beta-ketoacyl-acyl carrier protein synthase III [Gracilaria tikvahiae]UAD88147.1 beta-ketoacyl-acyl carrier protein synthase III [Gracilaria tikvahiae]